MAGLINGTGEPVFGLGGEGPTATPDEVKVYLRSLDDQDWGASLRVPQSRPAREIDGGRNSKQQPRPQRKASLPVQPIARPAPPAPRVRDATAADATRITELIGELGQQIVAEQVRTNLAALKKACETPLVATLGEEVVGMCGVAKRTLINRPLPVGRITTLIVTKRARGLGIGKMLVTAAEAWMRTHGCSLVEVTSNDRLAEAHAFYRHLGYERTSIRFAKTL